MRFTLDKKIIAASVFFALGVALITAGVVAPMIRQIKEMERTIYNLRSFLERRYQKTVKMRTSAKDLEQIKEEVRFIDAYLFRRDDALRLITDLEAAASRHRVSYKITSPNLDAAEAGQIIDLSVQASGPYRNVIEYLHDLETIPYFLIIKDLRLSNVEGSETAPLAQLHLTMSLYVAR